MRIVKSHGGFLRVESEAGQGTTFEVFLPRAVEASLEPAHAPTGDLPRGGGELILVADDERAIRSLVAEGLAAQGYRVLTAANGEEAVHVFHQHSGEIRLVITDSAMPGMDGRGVISEIRKLRADLPVILASGDSPVENRCAGEGILLLGKPYSLEEVLTAVHRLLGHKSRAQAS
jgi:DNA-binding response OmpR family regulator